MSDLCVVTRVIHYCDASLWFLLVVGCANFLVACGAFSLVNCILLIANWSLWFGLVVYYIWDIGVVTCFGWLKGLFVFSVRCSRCWCLSWGKVLYPHAIILSLLAFISESAGASKARWRKLAGYRLCAPNWIKI